MVLKIVVIYGSVRDERKGIRVAKFVINNLKKRKHSVIFVDPLEQKIPLLKKRYSGYEKGKAPKNLEKLHKIFKNADAYVIVSSEYNHGVPPALKNIIDHFYKEYYFKPSLIVTYSGGSFGGIRAAEQWRSILAEVGMPAIPTALPISNIGDFSEKGIPKDPKYNERINKPLNQLEWYAKALKTARKKSIPE